ncbi:MAG: hypothetical protein RQ715_10220 [Methylococcales bacterium]|nr:hypothetical protein [Methylococcales bacterium]
MPYSVAKSVFIAALISYAATFLLACSDDTASRSSSAKVAKTQAKTAANRPFDHPHKGVTDLIKHQFEHQFADQCVAREIRNSPNKDLDKQRWAKPCMCIAQFMLKDLTAKEAELFLKEHKDTQSLRIRFENAAYHCLQAKQTQPKGPKLFGR